MGDAFGVGCGVEAFGELYGDFAGRGSGLGGDDRCYGKGGEEGEGRAEAGEGHGGVLLRGFGEVYAATLRQGCRFAGCILAAPLKQYVENSSSFQGECVMRSYPKSTIRYCVLFSILATADTTRGQLSLPGFRGKSAQSKQQADDQKASKLLHDKLPLVLDANTAYPTVPDEDLLGGPFHGRVLPITLETLTKPLPPGDWVVPTTFSAASIPSTGAARASPTHSVRHKGLRPKRY